MGFFNDLLDTISGEGRREMEAERLKAQLNISQQQLDEMLREEQLKYSPEAVAERKRIYTVVGIVLIVLIISYVWYKTRS